MFKKLLTISAMFITTTSFCMEPYQAPKTPEKEAYINALGYIELRCPCCGEFRLWPSEIFIINRRMKLTQKDEQAMVQAITDYTGDKVAGRFCQFCGRSLPIDDEFE
jgi:cytochrome c-type biogenesis protein CcmH/NrfF